MNALGLGHILQKGSDIIDKAKSNGISELTVGGVAGSPFHVDFKTGIKLSKDPDLFKFQNKQERAEGKVKEKAAKLSHDSVKTLGFKGSYTTFLKKLGLIETPSFTFPGFGGGLDIHKAIGKLPRPKASFTPSKYRYMGPYNPLDKQLKYDPSTGEVLEWYVQPYNIVDERAAYHDICYDMGKNND